MSNKADTPQWTKEFPDEPGYYWFRSEKLSSEPCILERSGLLTYTSGDPPRNENEFKRAFGKRCSFYGPLAAPEVGP